MTGSVISIQMEYLFQFHHTLIDVFTAQVLKVGGHKRLPLGINLLPKFFSLQNVSLLHQRDYRLFGLAHLIFPGRPLSTRPMFWSRPLAPDSTPEQRRPPEYH